MSRKNFFVCVDRDGNMPVLSDKPLKAYYTQYVNDTPVVTVPYIGQDQVWCYKDSMFYSLVAGRTQHDGKPMPMYRGRVVTF